MTRRVGGSAPFLSQDGQGLRVSLPMCELAVKILDVPRRFTCRFKRLDSHYLSLSLCQTQLTGCRVRSTLQ